MIRSRFYKLIAGFVIGTVLMIAGCTNLQAVYDKQAYQQAVSLKVEAKALMNKATTPYENHISEVNELRTELNKAYEYAKGLPNNQETTRQWKIMRNPNRNLLGGFLKRWKQESTLSDGFVEEANELVSEAFTKIIELESGKRES